MSKCLSTASAAFLSFGLGIVIAVTTTESQHFTGPKHPGLSSKDTVLPGQALCRPPEMQSASAEHLQLHIDLT